MVQDKVENMATCGGFWSLGPTVYLLCGIQVVRMVIRHHEEQKQKEERAKREEQAKLRRIASSIAKEVKQFWSNVEKVCETLVQSQEKCVYILIA